jgi:Ca2+-binding RTX toxin-like protein
MTSLMGEGGNDILTGGLGNDQFDFDTALPGAGVDTINDFVVGTTKFSCPRAVFSALETVPLLVMFCWLQTLRQSMWLPHQKSP